jgi:outer membrane protein
MCHSVTMRVLLLLSLAALCLLLHPTSPALAEAADCIVSSAPQESEPGKPFCDDLYPVQEYSTQESPWRVGLSAGVGRRSNPLINADDIPIYLVVQLSYFGDRFFFDNGDFGWALTEGDHWQANLIAGIGGERSFYSFLNDGPVSISPGVLGLDAGLDPSPEPAVGESDGPEEVAPKVEAPERDLTVEGGIELLFSQGSSEFQLQLLTDISGQHHGQEAWGSWAVVHQSENWRIIPSIGLNWKSSAAANYYYGVESDEAQLGLPAYSVGSATNVFARLSMTYSLSEHWQIVSLLQYEKLASKISNSPSVEDDHVTTAYIGLYYEF